MTRYSDPRRTASAFLRTVTSGTVLVVALLAAPAAPDPVSGTGNGVEAQELDTAGTASPGSSSTARPYLDAVPLDDAEIRVDGHLDEDAWSRASVARNFIQVEPDEGEPATHPTEARVLYGSDALYVAIRAYDPAPDSIVGQLTRRGQNSHSDRLHVVIDSYHDRRTAFHFGVNPVGVKLDIYRYDDHREDSNWEAVWEVATAIDEEGWTAEFRIPFSQLRFENAPVQTWGINFGREIARYGELSTWAPLSPREQAIVSRSGELRGLRNLSRPSRMEMLPYGMTRMTRAPGDPENPFHDPTDVGGTVGADVKYAVTSNLTLDLTVNPDFGQVEADPAQVNLTAFETFFSERRPFFMEGASIFNFDIGGPGNSESLFYSRRIGRAPQGTGRVDGAWVDAPSQSRIMGAWKLSGKTSAGWSIGALHAVTGEEEARVASAVGDRNRTSVEPLTNYSVLRVQKDFREGRSALGAIGTTVNREGGVADALALHRGAYTGGVDYRHRFGPSDHYEVKGYVLGSHVTGSEEALLRTQRSSARLFQRPDAGHVELNPDRTSLTGWTASTELWKTGGSWRFATLLQARSPEFEANDLGFMQMADMFAQGGWMGYQRTQSGEHLRRWGLDLNAWRVQTFGGERLEMGTNVGGNFQHNDQWGGYGGVARQFEKSDPVLLRGGAAFRTEAGWNGWNGFYTDSRKDLQLNLNQNWSLRPESDSWRWSVSPNLRWRPSERATVRVGPSFTRNVNDRQWVGRVDAGESHYLLGRLDQTTLGITGRLDLAFTANLSLQLYAQPFVSAGSYADFKAVTDPGAPRYEDRFRRLEAVPVDDGARYRADLAGDGTAATFRNPDFNVLQLRSNAVLRWEYRPGSTLFLVWSQARDDFHRDGDFSFGRDFDSLFSVEPENVLMLKVSYWFTP